MTPSRWHYVTVESAATPLWLHQLYNRWRGRAESDTFPTHYRANAKATLTALFAAEGFSPSSVAQIETAPNYLTLLAPAFLVGVAYERLVNRIELLSRFRVLLLGEFVKTSTDDPVG